MSKLSLLFLLAILPVIFTENRDAIKFPGNINDEGTGIGGTGGTGTGGDDQDSGLDWQGDNNGGSPIYKVSILPPLISIILLSI